jgi:prepilin-type N-terminal cleavage/methylation domain-containing protein
MSARSPKSPSSLILGLLESTSRSTKIGSDAAVQGLTLIECLVAMVIITITVVAITPPVFLATATRIQSRRAEQANEIAQQEIDRVRGMIERGSYKVENLPASIGTSTNWETVAKPDKTIAPYLISPGSCPGKDSYPSVTPVPGTNVIPVDVDGDCTAEYVMQVFRTDGCVPAGVTDPTGVAVPPYAFSLGVRVYAYVDKETLPDLTTKRGDLALTTGRRDAGGDSRKPLQTIYTRLSRSNSSNALQCADKS